MLISVTREMLKGLLRLLLLLLLLPHLSLLHRYLHIWPTPPLPLAFQTFISHVLDVHRKPEISQLDTDRCMTQLVIPTRFMLSMILL
jgi:hypothetical protein